MPENVVGVGDDALDDWFRFMVERRRGRGARSGCLRTCGEPSRSQTTRPPRKLVLTRAHGRQVMTYHSSYQYQWQNQGTSYELIMSIGFTSSGQLFCTRMSEFSQHP